MRADRNLLFVVGHANLLHSLANLGDEQTQRFEREHAASNAKVEARGAHSEQLYSMSEKFRSKLTSAICCINTDLTCAKMMKCLRLRVRESRCARHTAPSLWKVVRLRRMKWAKRMRKAEKEELL
jgi:hypothetical protein